MFPRRDAVNVADEERTGQFPGCSRRLEQAQAHLAPGPYYNDLSCIDCGMCPEIAPLIFKRQEDAGYSYVYRQPVTPEEIALAEEAKESCPTESIGNDGNEG